MLSSRGNRNVAFLGVPWKYAVRDTYDPETSPEGVISFALAEHASMRSEIVNYINKKVAFDVDSICYRSRSRSANSLPNALAAHLNKYLHPIVPIEPETVVEARSATALGSMLGFALAEPGDGILVSRPIYGRFELDYGIEAGVQIVYADTDAEEAFSPECVQKYEQALQSAKAEGIKIRALMIVNPNNPVGRCYPEETLKEILKLCSKHQLHIISDEVYALSQFDSGNPNAVPFTSLLSVTTPDLIDPNLVHLLYGFSKDFASGGLHLGFLVSQNEALRQACKVMGRFYDPSSVAVTIGTAILEDDEFVSRFTERSRQSLTFSYRAATSVLDKEGIDYVRGGNAGFFIYIDLSPYLPNPTLESQEREFLLAQKLLENGLFLHPGEEHGKAPGWFRLVFTQEEQALREGLRRLIYVVKSLSI